MQSHSDLVSVGLAGESDQQARSKASLEVTDGSMVLCAFQRGKLLKNHLEERDYFSQHNQNLILDYKNAVVDKS